MKRTRGLTLGKFAPLHRGHQYLIETALSEMDEVIVVIYDSPEVTAVPLDLRAKWIKTLYPAIHVIEAWDGPKEIGDTPEIKRKHEDYILNKLGLRGITHFYSSEFYGEHMSAALGAVNRIVDFSRKVVPISATEIRKNAFLNRDYIHPVVYRDLIVKVVFLGAPSTGKTTIAARLAEEYKTVWMPEYGREYWERHQVNRRLSLHQLTEIAEGHLEREDALLLQANRFLFTDTNAITTYLFSLYYHNAASQRLRELADEAASRYTLHFLCDTDIPYEDTWDRSGAVSRQLFQKQTMDELISRGVPFFRLRGDLQDRIEQAKILLEKYQHYA